MSKPPLTKQETREANAHLGLQLVLLAVILLVVGWSLLWLAPGQETLGGLVTAAGGFSLLGSGFLFGILALAFVSLME